eukprot:CAMPEP_0182454820 /NCGR_PEP_ID=MMETSP1319-20130603/1279_1 /TAXON_ID=172717 /ORGANISM="Bolidomonas pacifica, Strain RCC208" /LENGTH=142 /DNA_ID=CAMNT_0024652845 /DNA_START=23 /DNA_END=451 /DNA_ORIENTATION=+
MPRRRRMPTQTRSRQPAQKSNVPARRPATQAPAQQQSGGGGLMGGLMGTVVQGMAFGTGSAVAHRAVGAVAEGMSGDGGEAPAQYESQDQQQQQHHIDTGNQPCMMEQQTFYTCLQQNQGQVTACTDFFNAVQNCQQMQQRF